MTRFAGVLELVEPFVDAAGGLLGNRQRAVAGNFDPQVLVLQRTRAGEQCSDGAGGLIVALEDVRPVSQRGYFFRPEMQLDLVAVHLHGGVAEVACNGHLPGTADLLMVHPLAGSRFVEGVILDFHFIRQVHEGGDGFVAFVRGGVEHREYDLVPSDGRVVDSHLHGAERAPHDAFRDVARLIEAVEHVQFNLVHAAARDGIVRVALEEELPRQIEQRLGVFGAERAGGDGERLGEALEGIFRARVGLFHAAAAARHVAVEVHLLPQCAWCPALAHEHREVHILHRFLHLGEVRGKAAVEDRITGFEQVLRLADQLDFQQVGLGAVQPLHIGKVLRPRVLQFLRFEVGQRLPQVGLVDLLLHIEQEVMPLIPVRPRKVEGQPAFGPLVLPVRGLHPVHRRAPDAEVEVVPRHRAHARAIHARAVRRLVDELGLRLFRLDAVVEQNRVNVESAVNLRHLGGLAVGERAVPGKGYLTVRQGLLHAPQQVSHQ
ncbi:MAG: hypothetical protein BWY06_02372 [Candidatus Latescibacteria bacterium ADurb.Bin168]|nr:MAG: hypothetical protein BWY06_02372 [Candidatus Latescibacteria bacterium ADurb.Bin168]